MTGLIILVLASIGGLTWWRLLKGKEQARHAASVVCRHHRLVLMDDTVMLDAIQLRREDPVGAWGLKYRFEFAREGILRKGGAVLIAPGQATTVVIDTEDGQLIERL